MSEERIPDFSKDSEEKVVGKGNSAEKNEKRDKFLENCLYLPVAPKDAKKRKIECECERGLTKKSKRKSKPEQAEANIPVYG